MIIIFFRQKGQMKAVLLKKAWYIDHSHKEYHNETAEYDVTYTTTLMSIRTYSLRHYDITRYSQADYFKILIQVPAVQTPVGHTGTRKYKCHYSTSCL